MGESCGSHRLSHHLAPRACLPGGATLLMQEVARGPFPDPGRLRQPLDRDSGSRLHEFGIGPLQALGHRSPTPAQVGVGCRAAHVRFPC